MRLVPPLLPFSALREDYLLALESIARHSAVEAPDPASASFSALPTPVPHRPQLSSSPPSSFFLSPRPGGRERGDAAARLPLYARASPLRRNGMKENERELLGRHGKKRRARRGAGRQRGKDEHPNGSGPAPSAHSSSRHSVLSISFPPELEEPPPSPASVLLRASLVSAVHKRALAGQHTVCEAQGVQ